jgi:hypothetical protein
VKRVDRHAAGAVARPFCGALAGVTGVALLVGLRRLVDRAPGGLDPSNLAALLVDLALSALPATLPIALGFATALAGARLRSEAVLSALAAAGASPLRMLAAPCGFAVGVSLSAWPIAHLVAPTALDRIAPTVVEGRLAKLKQRVSLGHPGPLETGDAGAVYVVGPEQVGWLAPKDGAGVARLRGLAVRRETVTASLGAGVAWLGCGDRATEIRFASARIHAPMPERYVSPWDRRPGRAWSTSRLRARARAASEPPEARARWRRLAGERDALPALVMGYFLWAAGATWTGRRARAPVLVVAVSVALHYVVGRVVAALITPSVAGGAALAAPLALAAVGAALLARERVRP